MRKTELELLLEECLFQQNSLFLQERITYEELFTVMELSKHFKSPQLKFMQNRYKVEPPLLFTRITSGKEYGVEFWVNVKKNDDGILRNADEIIRNGRYLSEVVSVHHSSNKLPNLCEPGKPGLYAPFNKHPILRVAFYHNSKFQLMHIREYKGMYDYQKHSPTATFPSFYAYQDLSERLREMDGAKVSPQDVSEAIINFILVKSKPI